MKVASALETMLVDVATLTLDEKNVRLHPDRNLDAIKASLERFGQRKPVVVRAGVVIAGNGTLIAARALGWDRVAAVDANDLSPEEALAYALADNKTGDLAEWDLQELGEIFRELPEELRDATGFMRFEQEPLLQETWTPPAIDENTNVHEHTDMVSIRIDATEAPIVRAAIDKIKRAEAQDLSDGRALELICADYLA